MLEDFRLKVFMSVAAERSFTKAAAALGISQPAVSQNISELERETGLKLFDRLRGEVAITPQGVHFSRHAERILASYEELNMVFCNSRINSRTAPVRLYVSPLIEGLLMHKIMESVESLRPGLTVDLVDTAEAAHVCILGTAEKKDADLLVKVNVLSDDILLRGFFRQLVDYCM